MACERVEGARVAGDTSPVGDGTKWPSWSRELAAVQDRWFADELKALCRDLSRPDPSCGIAVLRVE